MLEADVVDAINESADNIRAVGVEMQLPKSADMAISVRDCVSDRSLGRCKPYAPIFHRAVIRWFLP